jgi:hypothetical protein
MYAYGLLSIMCAVLYTERHSGSELSQVTLTGPTSGSPVALQHAPLEMISASLNSPVLAQLKGMLCSSIHP